MLSPERPWPGVGAGAAGPRRRALRVAALRRPGEWAHPRGVLLLGVREGVKPRVRDRRGGPDG
ncbi:hypothetical protein CTKZ_19950 [Cellulomonas algicola]|uniref:Uncharacterized protein n=1 Tax=Cellulomonas algicola TaxID=2071633 RepID=A0A401V0F8_9CELL|nr:hypothetical protein CTKZ_19950 [Cellulomonas algicola]